MNNKIMIFLSMLIFVFGYAIYEALKLDSKLSDSASSRTGTVMKELPDNLEFFTLESKEKFKIKELLNNGDKIVIHFWATWCGPCEVEFPELIELTHQLQSYKSVKFLLVAINDDLVKVKKFLKKFDVSNENIILLLDEKNEYQRLGTYKLPETFVFNSDSKIIKKFSGQQPWTQKYLVSFFKSL